LINITELNNEAATDVRGELEERKKEVRETSRKERKKKENANVQLEFVPVGRE